MNIKIYEKIKFLVEKKYHNINLENLFQTDEKRFDKYHLQVDNILLDYSKNKFNREILDELINLAHKSKVIEMRDSMFLGDKINSTEYRPVLHTVLRDFSTKPVYVNSVNIKNDIVSERNRIKKMVSDIHSGRKRGFSGKKITNIVNIGIGGSNLGAKMAIKALESYRVKHINVHFLSNIDGSLVDSILKIIDPETTIFIVSSKSFSTQETIINANTVKIWLLEFYKNIKSIDYHFIVISSNKNKTQEFGISHENCFNVWDWVGGRYSLWSSIGITIALAIGFDNFQDILKGGAVMDEHFTQAPFHQNMPVILALISILYSNFYGSQSQALIVYDERLKYLIDYLQQADMESNGKLCKRDGKISDLQTGNVLWGGVGTDGQHAFHQLLHQGNVLVPVDFMMVRRPSHGFQVHHNALLANCLAQSQALMQGKSFHSIKKSTAKEKEKAKEKSDSLISQMVLPGNRPSNTILIEELTPKSLGEIVALYEHKIFVQGVIWNINSFDQWGVELGKVLGQSILSAFDKNDINCKLYDQSTIGLLSKIIRKDFSK